MAPSHTKNRAMLDTQVKIVTPTETIRPSKTEKLLGCWVKDDRKWTEHLRDNKRSLQIIMNKVARVVTRLDWSTPARELLAQCGWLSVNQLIFYHSVLQVHKVKLSKTTKYLYIMHNSWAYQYRTRQAESGLIQLVGKPKLELSKNSFKFRAANQYNQLPSEIINCSTIKSFKCQAKAWIKTNVSLD